MQYDIRVTIQYSYPSPASSGRHLLRLMPRALPGKQRVLSRTLEVTPAPVEQVNGIDFFGNETVEVALASPHKDSSFTVTARVECTREGQGFDMSGTLPGLAGEIAAQPDLTPDAPHHFLGPSTRIPRHDGMAAYAREVAGAQTTVYDIVRALGQRIHEDFAFNPQATDVDTPTEAAFEQRAGVCQDFAHVMITCLREIGIPAAYVSGFLRTIPPQNQPRLEGADAMHAWVRAWCGRQMGWVEYDPTNAVEAFNDHVVVAYGRDYADVAPVKGYMRSVGDHTTRQLVDVEPLENA